MSPLLKNGLFDLVFSNCKYYILQDTSVNVKMLKEMVVVKSTLMKRLDILVKNATMLLVVAVCMKTAFLVVCIL